MNKIGWCDITWNPVVGCKNNCEYCYGKRMNQRFKFIEDWNKPEWKEKSFNKKFPKKPQRIFVGSMSEIYYWDEVWIQKVIDKTKEYPQHTFQFLTKFPDVYLKYVFPKNCWLGTTVTKDIELEGVNYFSNYNCIKFISFEPLLGNIIFTSFLEHYNWVIIGAETGSGRKGKIIPKRIWVEVIVNYCREINIPIYLKDSLKNIYPVEVKEFPVY